MTLFDLFKRTKGPFSAYFKVPVSIWKVHSKGFLGGLAALIFIIIWAIQVVVGTYDSFIWAKGKLYPPVIDTYDIVRSEITSRLNERTQIIQKRDCENSPKFELSFVNANSENQKKWILSCQKYSTAQRDYQMLIYKFENVNYNKAQVRYFEIRDMSVDGKIMQQYFEGKLYFERDKNGVWMIVNATRNPLKQSEQVYSSL